MSELPTSLNYASLVVLVVDDDQFMRAMVRSQLASFGIRNSQQASDGIEALGILESSTVDLVITDHQMEPMTGLDLTLHIRRNPKSTNPFVPVVMLTAHADMSLVKEARDAGVTEFLVKPFSTKQLQAKVRSALIAPRPFVKSEDFFGPDRRRKREGVFKGDDRRNDDEPEGR